MLWPLLTSVSRTALFIATAEGAEIPKPLLVALVPFTISVEFFHMPELHFLVPVLTQIGVSLVLPLYFIAKNEFPFR